MGKESENNMNGTLTFALYLSANFPFAKYGFSTSDKTRSGRSLPTACPASSKQCREICLTYAGTPFLQDNKLGARSRKTMWFAVDDEKFVIEPAQQNDLLLNVKVS